jgi:hypothetical protein
MSKWRTESFSGEEDEDTATPATTMVENGRARAIDDNDAADAATTNEKKETKKKKKKKKKKRRDGDGEHAEDASSDDDDDGDDNDNADKGLFSKWKTNLTQLFKKEPEPEPAKKKKKKKKRWEREEEEEVDIYADPTYIFTDAEKRVPAQHLPTQHPSIDGYWALDLARSDSLRELAKVLGAGIKGRESKAFRAKVERDAATLRIKTGSQNRNVDYEYGSALGATLVRVAQDGACKLVDMPAGIGFRCVGAGRARVWNAWSSSLGWVGRWLREALPIHQDDGCSLVTVFKFALGDGQPVCMRERKYLIDRGGVLMCQLDVHCRKIDAYESKKGLEFRVKRPVVARTNSHVANFDDDHYDWGEHCLRFKLYYKRAPKPADDDSGGAAAAAAADAAAGEE